MAAAALAAATAISACGASSTSSSNSAAHLTYAQAQQAAVTFADCVRSHGLPGLPDPASPRDLKESVSSSVAQSPAFRPAATACRHIQGGDGSPSQTAPPSQAQTAAVLTLARCLRRHGFPSFPTRRAAAR